MTTVSGHSTEPLEVGAELRDGAASLTGLTHATKLFPLSRAGLSGPGWNRTTARSFEGCRSIR